MPWLCWAALRDVRHDFLLTGAISLAGTWHVVHGNTSASDRGEEGFLLCGHLE